MHHYMCRGSIYPLGCPIAVVYRLKYSLSFVCLYIKCRGFLSFIVCSKKCPYIYIYRGADKSLARPGRKQAQKHVRDACDFNNIETRAVFKFVFLQGKAPKEIYGILTETLSCFLPGRAKDLSAPFIIHCFSLSSNIYVQ